MRSEDLPLGSRPETPGVLAERVLYQPPASARPVPRHGKNPVGSRLLTGGEQEHRPGHRRRERPAGSVGPATEPQDVAFVKAPIAPELHRREASSGDPQPDGGRAHA
jgi:hypothetical protein